MVDKLKTTPWNVFDYIDTDEDLAMVFNEMVMTHGAGTQFIELVSTETGV